MKKSTNTIRWIGVTVFGIMSAYALSEHVFLGALLFLLGGLIIAPLGFVQKLRSKLKLNKAISIVLAVVLLFSGTLTISDSEISDDDTGSLQITETVSDDTSETDKTADTSNPLTDVTNSSSEDTSSEDEVSSKTESTSKPSGFGVGTGQGKAVNLSNIPAYSGKAFVTINNNVPNFSANELKTTGYETYSDLDSLGRTQFALASVGKDTMPKDNEERGSISSIKPTGWEQAKYDCVSGGWLYNRCHLIGWQLSAENANKKNLITGTKYLNIDGMLPFENMVADYIKETGNHVAYRITPIYQGNNLLVSGVQMEAYSVEDNGEGICFNVYCYNVQPNITIDYATGVSSGTSSSGNSNEESSSKSESSACSHDQTTVRDKVNATCTENGYSGDTYCNACNKVIKTGSQIKATGHNTEIRNKKEATTSSEGYTGDTYCKVCGVKTATGKAIPKIEDNTQQESNSQTVYVTKTGKRYHSTTSCRGLNNANAIYDSTLSEALGRGLTPCTICY